MIRHLFDIGLTALWPSMRCYPLSRSWIYTLWAAHYALGNWHLLREDDDAYDAYEAQP